MSKWDDARVCVVEVVSRHRTLRLEVPSDKHQHLSMMVAVGTTSRQVMQTAEEMWPADVVAELRAVLAPELEDVPQTAQEPA
jgi:hypothetical protein